MNENFFSLERERRDALMNAAFKEFATNGYEDASTNRIAENAGISKALMFHYIGSKKELFLTLSVNGLDLIRQEYLDRTDMGERDILERLRQAFIAKIGLMARYPWIFEFIKALSLAKSDAPDREIGAQIRKLQKESTELLFGNINDSKFKAELDAERCKHLILWGITGFCDQMTAALLEREQAPDLTLILSELQLYLEELRKALYKG